jgi:hypothetical protein
MAEHNPRMRVRVRGWEGRGHARSHLHPAASSRSPAFACHDPFPCRLRCAPNAKNPANNSTFPNEMPMKIVVCFVQNLKQRSMPGPEGAWNASLPAMLRSCARKGGAGLMRSRLNCMDNGEDMDSGGGEVGGAWTVEAVQGVTRTVEAVQREG